MPCQITVRMSDELRGALDETARRMRRKPSEVVRLALEAYLQPPAPGDSPASRVRHLLGSLDSGTPDLAERHREYVLESLRDDP